MIIHGLSGPKRKYKAIDWADLDKEIIAKLNEISGEVARSGL